MTKVIFYFIIKKNMISKLELTGDMNDKYSLKREIPELIRRTNTIHLDDKKRQPNKSQTGVYIACDVLLFARTTKLVVH